VPEVPEVPDVPELPCMPCEPEAEPEVSVAPAGAPELVLPAAEPPCMLLSLLPFVELQADRPKANASKPAKTALWCFCFMIDSFCWNFSVGVRDDAACHFGKRREQGRRSS
jgi:hypothetical protein